MQDFSHPPRNPSSPGLQHLHRCPNDFAAASEGPGPAPVFLLEGACGLVTAYNWAPYKGLLGYVKFRVQSLERLVGLRSRSSMGRGTLPITRLICSNPVRRSDARL